jgi:hypothetical protein
VVIFRKSDSDLPGSEPCKEASGLGSFPLNQGREDRPCFTGFPSQTIGQIPDIDPFEEIRGKEDFLC